MSWIRPSGRRLSVGRHLSRTISKAGVRSSWDRRASKMKSMGVNPTKLQMSPQYLLRSVELFDFKSEKATSRSTALLLAAVDAQQLLKEAPQSIPLIAMHASVMLSKLTRTRGFLGTLKEQLAPAAHMQSPSLKMSRTMMMMMLIIAQSTLRSLSIILAMKQS